MCGQIFPVFLAALIACALLVLPIFSVPFISQIYFLHASIFGGVKFGILGWCTTNDGICTPKKFGYHFDPELTPILVMLHVFYPIAAGFALLTALSLIPALFSRHRHLYPFPVFSIVSLLAFLTAAAALGISLATWVTAIQRFHQNGLSATLGPAIWITIPAVVLLFIVAVNAECGMLCRGHAGRRRPHIIYTY